MRKDIYLDNKKTCSVCKQIKPLTDYYKQLKINKNREEYTYYHPECKECAKLRATLWIEKNPEKYKIYRRKYDSNPKRKEPQYRFNKTRLENGRYREWMRNNPEKSKMYRENHIKHEISEEEWIRCKNYFTNENGEWCCAYCGFLHKDHTKKRLNKIYKQDLHKEHVAHDGNNDLSNCIPSCQRCNSSKHTKNMVEWYQQQPFYSVEWLERISKWIGGEYKSDSKEIKKG